MMNIDLTPILQALIALVASVVTLRLLPWIKARTTAQQQELLASTVRILVYAAEQIYGAGQGTMKLRYVKAELGKRGFDLDAAAIEAAVRKLSLGEVWQKVPSDALG